MRAFSLIELMIAFALFGMTIGAAIGVYVMGLKMWHATALGLATSRDANMALSRLVYGMGANNGLRAASSISIGTNYNGTWTGGNNYPPQPWASTHYLTPGSPDGSWRLLGVNGSDTSDVPHWIDYNKKAGNIVYWMNTNDPSSRQLICNYVSNAVVSTNGSGLSIRLTIRRQEGRFASTNQVGTFILMRNRPL